MKNNDCYRNKAGIFCRIDKGHEVAVTHRSMMHAALRRISAQFPQLPEARLMLAVIANAICDLSDKSYRKSALSYLRTANYYHAEICGISSAWIHDTLEQMDLLND